jgi:phage head maturation protease
VQLIRSGNVTGSSFGFTVLNDVWEERDGKVLRTVLEIDQKFDIGPVVFPAYANTTVSTRSLECFTQWTEAAAAAGQISPETRERLIRHAYLRARMQLH